MDPRERQRATRTTQREISVAPAAPRQGRVTLPFSAFAPTAPSAVNRTQRASSARGTEVEHALAHVTGGRGREDLVGVDAALRGAADAEPAPARAPEPARPVERARPPERVRPVESVPAPRTARTPTQGATPPAAPHPPVRRELASPLFRSEALAAYERGDRIASVLRVTGVSRWAMLLALAALVVGAALLCGFGKVEVSARARGVLRAPFGLQPVVAQVAGTVREVLVQNGQQVEAGQVLIRLDATPLRAALQEATQHLTAVEDKHARTLAAARTGHERSVALLRARVGLLERRAERQHGRISRRERSAARVNAPELDGVLETQLREEHMERVELARDDSLRIAEEVSSLRLQIATLERGFQEMRHAADQELADARARQVAATTLLEQTALVAPSAGRVDALRASVGQALGLGEWALRVVQDTAPQELVAYVPEKERAFLAPGARAEVEFDQLPVSEFGLLAARVRAVGHDIADQQELRLALGDAAPPPGAYFRVELALEEGSERARARPYLRPGALAKARIALRDQRILTLLFEPARKWLE